MLSINVIDTSPEHKNRGQTAYFKIRVEITAAIVDRLTFAGQIIETGSISYRLAHARTIKATPKASTATTTHKR
jgi:hypothetical protein